MGTESGHEMALLGHGMVGTHVPASRSEGQLSWEQRGCLGQVGCPCLSRPLSASWAVVGPSCP